MSMQIYEKLSVSEFYDRYKNSELKNCNKEIAATALKTAGVRNVKKEHSYLCFFKGKTLSFMVVRNKVFLVQVSTPTRKEERGLFKVIGKDNRSRYFII